MTRLKTAEWYQVISHMMSRTAPSWKALNAQNKSQVNQPPKINEPHKPRNELPPLQIWGSDYYSLWGLWGSRPRNCHRAFLLSHWLTECSCSTESFPPVSAAKGVMTEVLRRNCACTCYLWLTSACHWSQPGGIWPTLPAALLPYWK